MNPHFLHRVIALGVLCSLAPLTAQHYGPAGPRHLPLGSQPAPIGVVDIDRDGDPDIIDGTPDIWRNDGNAVFAVETSRIHFQAQRFVAADLDGNGSTDLVFHGRATTPLLRLQHGGRYLDHSVRDLFFAEEIEVADLDGDGRDELVLVSEYPTVTGVRQLTATGEDLEPAAIAGFPASATAADNPHTARCTDIDGDGDIDLIAGYHDRVEIFANDGAGRLVEIQEVPLGSASPGKILHADIDGDQDTDVLVVAPDGSVTVLDNDSSGRFAVRAGVVAPANRPIVDAHVVDVDGDGHVDIVLASDALIAHRNDGGGRFPTTRALVDSWQPGQRALFADFDCDGRDDLLVDRGPTLLLQSASGAFVAAGGAAIPRSVGMLPKVLIADFDGDSELDLFGNGRAPGALLLGDGRQAFRDASDRLPPLSRAALSAASADLDRDGDIDLVLGMFHAPSVVILNDGTGRFTEHNTMLSNTADTTQAIAIGDLDGDGLPEVVTAGSSRNVTVWRNRMPTDLVADPAAMPTLTTMVVSLELVDLDGDGDLDMLCGQPGTSHPPAPNPVRRFDNDGRGRFRENTPIRPGGMGPITSFDFDRDGDADIVAGQHVWVNDGRGNFVPLAPSRQPELPLSGAPLIVADVDGDGFDDILTTATDGVALHNDGRGGFTDATAAWMDRRFASHALLATADVDRDGDADLIVGGPGGPELWVSRTRDLQLVHLAARGGTLQLEIAANGLAGASAWLAFSTGPDSPRMLAGLGQLRLDIGALIPGIALAVPLDRPASVSLTVPTDPQVIGLRLAAQALIGASPTGVRLSNAVATTVLR